MERPILVIAANHNRFPLPYWRNASRRIIIGAIATPADAGEAHQQTTRSPKMYG